MKKGPYLRFKRSGHKHDGDRFAISSTIFDDLSGNYERVTDAVGYTGPKWLFNQLKLLSLPDNSFLIDFACATGNLGAILKSCFPKAKLVGVDNSVNMVKVAIEKGIYSEVFWDDLENSDLPKRFSELAQLIVCFGVSEFINDRRSLVLNCNKCLKKKGYLLISFKTSVTDNQNGLTTKIGTKSDFLNLLVNEGFSIVFSEEKLGYQNDKNSINYFYVLAQKNQ